MATTKEISRNLGGDRLGSGAKNDITLSSYSRSTHDLSRTWRSSMNVGTLVPFAVELGLNGDTFSMNLDNITRTIPSIGPLYGSYKLQLDVFECPIRLYNGLLHNNMTGIGLEMAKVKFPKITVSGRVYNRTKFNEDLNKSQISKSSLINYLGLNGIGDVNFNQIASDYVLVHRKFNAIPLIAYWDIYKNYYANKQEEKGAFIKANPQTELNLFKTAVCVDPFKAEKKMLLVETPNNLIPPTITVPANSVLEIIEDDTVTDEVRAIRLQLKLSGLAGTTNISNIQIVLIDGNENITQIPINTFAEEWTITDDILMITVAAAYRNYGEYYFIGVIKDKDYAIKNEGLEIQTFDLSDIDDMRIAILQETGLNNELQVDNVNSPLWNFMTGRDVQNHTLFKYGQHGLGLKTYQSDLYNNWLQTEWIDGANGINKITAIDTSSGSFEIDALILGKKIYNMLNRVAVSGGSFEDWQEAVYSVKAIRRAETPIYRGGMSAEIMFSEVVSNAETEDKPLGTLAGKGGEHNKKGGHIEISCDEPCIILGIVSITPRVDYSQGNSWILTELDNMDDLHKPQLDGIGFQDLLQERMAYWGTVYEGGHWKKLAVGKIPAWLNYMTAVNETHGDFAEEDKCMFMTLNRRYQYPKSNDGIKDMGIQDITTYIDPAKYNYIFADASLEAQNFWVQIGIGIHARRVMSAKIIPFA